MSKPTALAADVFAGGFSLGVQQAGFDVLAHFEESKYGVATARHNFPRMPIHVGFDQWPVDEYRGRVNFVFANPPCAAWSVAGYTRDRGTDKWKTDPRTECTVRCMTLRRRIRPEVYATESVTQAWSKGREFFEPLMQEAADDGYSTTVLLHDAQSLGLPQVRKRVFFVFHRIGFHVQAPNWSPPPVPLDFLPDRAVGEPHCSMSQKKFMKQLKHVRPGERLAKFWERKMADKDPDKWERRADGAVVGRPSYGHYRLPVDRPGGAIVGYDVIHPTEHRFLSTEEMQLLSGFPASFHFTPNGASARAAEIARGVCPTVARWLAEQVRRNLSMAKEVTQPEQRVLDLRRPPDQADLEGAAPQLITLGPQPDPAPRSVQVKKPVALAPGVRVLTSALSNPMTMPRPKEGVGSGKFIKLLLDMERYTTDEIVAAVKRHYPASKATGADVAYHRGEMREAGRMVGVVRVNKAGERKLVPYTRGT